jgi:hypothetical protein
MSTIEVGGKVREKKKMITHCFCMQKKKSIMVDFVIKAGCFRKQCMKRTLEQMMKM